MLTKFEDNSVVELDTGWKRDYGNGATEEFNCFEVWQDNTLLITETVTHQNGDVIKNNIMFDIRDFDKFVKYLIKARINFERFESAYQTQVELEKLYLTENETSDTIQSTEEY